MPNDYDVVRAARKNPEIKMGQGMQRVESDETGAYHDRIKIKPRFGLLQDPPKVSDADRQRAAASRVSKT